MCGFCLPRCLARIYQLLGGGHTHTCIKSALTCKGSHSDTPKLAVRLHNPDATPHHVNNNLTIQLTSPASATSTRLSGLLKRFSATVARLSPIDLPAGVTRHTGITHSQQRMLHRQSIRTLCVSSTLHHEVWHGSYHSWQSCSHAVSGHGRSTQAC